MQRLLIALSIACLFPVQATSFSVTGNSWESGSARVYVGRENFFWQTKMREAAEDWNDNTRFRFRVSHVSYPPCDEEGFLLNGFEFREVDCSQTLFGDFVLAVAEWLPDEDGYTRQAGITFNSNFEWGSYSGPIHEEIVDFNRVALHELGHMLGLGHEETEPSIMSSVIGDVSDVTEDDRAGVEAIYGDPPPEDDDGEDGDGGDGGDGGGSGGATVEQKCQIDQLSSAANYCKKHVKCEAKYVKDPAKDPGGAGRDACQAKARADFLAQWNDAIGDASSASGNCANQDSSATVDSIVDLGAVAVEAGIGGGDPLNPEDRKMRQKVMKKAASLCQKDFDAYERDVTQQDPVKLTNDLADGRSKFLNDANKAILKAASSGVVYDGDPLDSVADQTEQLAADFGALVAP
jgi:hypothetical protein